MKIKIKIKNKTASDYRNCMKFLFPLLEEHFKIILLKKSNDSEDYTYLELEK